jgi:uncharacterized protein
MTHETSAVIHNAAAAQFELDVEGQTALIAYRKRGDDVYVLYHTEVPPEFEGRGIGSRLVKGALEQIKTDGKRIVPTCSFIVAYLRRHPEYEALIAHS